MRDSAAAQRGANERERSSSAILRALSELDRWKRRREELRGEGDKVDRQIADRQIAYYEALAEDMKRETRPATTRDLLSSLLKP